jgi:hypothetical protein
MLKSVLCIWQKKAQKGACRGNCHVLQAEAVTNHSCDGTYAQKGSCQVIAALCSKAAVTNISCDGTYLLMHIVLLLAGSEQSPQLCLCL